MNADEFADAVARIDDGTATDADHALADRYDERVLQVAWDETQAAWDDEARRYTEGGES